MKRLGKKQNFHRSFSVLADLDINFVLEGHVRLAFVGFLGFCFLERKPRFCI